MVDDFRVKTGHSVIWVRVGELKMSHKCLKRKTVETSKWSCSLCSSSVIKTVSTLRILDLAVCRHERSLSEVKELIIIIVIHLTVSSKRSLDSSVSVGWMT